GLAGARLGSCPRSDPRRRDGHQRSTHSGTHHRRTELARAKRGNNRARIGDLALITQGNSNAEVARLTYLSPNTVKSYIRTIYRKIGVASRTQAVRWGVRH